MRRILPLGVALARAPFESSLRGAGAHDLPTIVQWMWFGRATGADLLPLFDAAFYLDHHPDVCGSGLGPATHFLRRGAAEGWDPHPLFDTAFYLERYPDVRGSGLNPLVHYLRFGAAEGRDPHPLFDTGFYLERYPEARASGLNPLVHFLRIGAARGLDPHPLFDTGFYRLQTPPLGVDDTPNALVHYLQQGAASAHERQPHPLFHPGYYLERNPDVARSGMDPLAHYCQSGAREGRRPHPLFDVQAYLAQCPEVRAADVNPLLHYLEQGAARGLRPHPLFDPDLALAEPRSPGQENPLIRYVQEELQRATHRDLSSPAGRSDGTILAFVAFSPSQGPAPREEDSTILALRLLSTLGWKVKAWSPSPAESGSPPVRALASAGVEILTPPEWPSPRAVLADTPGVDAILTEEGVEPATLVSAMVLHPRARLLRLLRRALDEPVSEELTPEVDGVLGCGFRPSGRPSIDLRGALGPGHGSSRDGAPASEWPGAAAERSAIAFLHRAGVRPPPSLCQRLASRARQEPRLSGRDILVLGVNPWRYRYQRPQHLGVELGRRGWRVLYVDPDFLPLRDPRPFAIEESPAERVYRLRLRTPGRGDIHAAPPAPDQVAALGEGLRELSVSVGLRAPVLLLQAPFWTPVADSVERSVLAYDCMDLYRAFPHAQRSLVALEDELLSRADVVVFSSAPLEHELEAGGRTFVVHNACEFERFSSASPRRLSPRPTVGYVGAIDRWFDVELVERCVDAHPGWDFVLVGSKAGLVEDAFRSRPNLRFTGEVDYDDVPALVAGFDVCLVPFVDNPLTRCVDPVKVYEYLAAGRPVVATALPELQRLEAGLVHLGSREEEFLRGLDAAMAEAGDEALGRRRRAWAAGQTWDARADELARALAPYS